MWGQLAKGPYIKVMSKGRTISRQGIASERKILCCVIMHIYASQEPQSIVMYSYSVWFSMLWRPHCFTVKALNVSVVLADYTDMWKMRGRSEHWGMQIGTDSERQPYMNSQHYKQINWIDATAQSHKRSCRRWWIIFILPFRCNLGGHVNIQAVMPAL